MRLCTAPQPCVHCAVLQPRIRFASARSRASPYKIVAFQTCAQAPSLLCFDFARLSFHGFCTAQFSRKKFFQLVFHKIAPFVLRLYTVLQPCIHCAVLQPRIRFASARSRASPYKIIAFQTCAQALSLALLPCPTSPCSNLASASLLLGRGLRPIKSSHSRPVRKRPVCYASILHGSVFTDFDQVLYQFYYY